MFTSSASAIRLFVRTSARTTLRAPVSRGHANFSAVRKARPGFFGTGRPSKLVFGAVLLASFALATTQVHADAETESSNVVSAYGYVNAARVTDPSYVVVDPNTSISF